MRYPKLTIATVMTVNAIDPLSRVPLASPTQTVVLAASAGLVRRNRLR